MSVSAELEQEVRRQTGAGPCLRRRLGCQAHVVIAARPHDVARSEGRRMGEGFRGQAWLERGLVVAQHDDALVEGVLDGSQARTAGGASFRATDGAFVQWVGAIALALHAAKEPAHLIAVELLVTRFAARQWR